MMLEGALEDWFYEVKARRAQLEAAALAEVRRWVWFKGLTCPLDPEPFRWERAGLRLARKVPCPGALPSARVGHFECGLDDAERLVVQRQYATEASPSVELVFHRPAVIRTVRFADVDHDFTPPHGVRELRLEEGRVVEKAGYSNLAMWPRRELTPADIAALKEAPAHLRTVLHERFIWEAGRLVRAEMLGHAWVVVSHLEFKPNGRLLRVWRPNPRTPSGRQLMWGKKLDA